MSIFEYDEEKEKELLRKAEYENGVLQGISQGKNIGEVSQWFLTNICGSIYLRCDIDMT